MMNFSFASIIMVKVVSDTLTLENMSINHLNRQKCVQLFGSKACGWCCLHHGEAAAEPRYIKRNLFLKKFYER